MFNHYCLRCGRLPMTISMCGIPSLEYHHLASRPAMQVLAATAHCCHKHWPPHPWAHRRNRTRLGDPSDPSLFSNTPLNYCCTTSTDISISVYIYIYIYEHTMADVVLIQYPTKIIGIIHYSRSRTRGSSYTKPRLTHHLLSEATANSVLTLMLNTNHSERGTSIREEYWKQTASTMWIIWIIPHYLCVCVGLCENPPRRKESK